MIMKTIIKRIIAFTILSTLVIAQLRSSLPERMVPVNTQGLSQARMLPMLDPNRFSMNHSFNVSMMNAGSQSMTMGAYTNQISYLLKDNLKLSTQFSLASPIGGINPSANNGLNGSQIYYDASLDYKPTENLFFKFSMNNYPRYNYGRPYSRFYNPR